MGTSGTNSFKGQALQTYQGKRTQSNNIDSTLLNAGFRPDGNSTELITNSNFQAGGPLLKNRMFYFGSANYQATHVKVPGFPSVVPSYIPTPLANTSDQDTTDILAGEGKLTYQLGPANRFEGYVSKQRYDKPNRGAGTGLTQDSDSKELDTFVISRAADHAVVDCADVQRDGDDELHAPGVERQRGTAWQRRAAKTADGRRPGGPVLRLRERPCRAERGRL